MERGSAMKFARLFAEGQIGTMKVKNRLVMPAMGSGYATNEGYVTQNLLDYYEERARGGVGLVIAEITCVDAPIGKTMLNQVCISDDKYIPGLADLVGVVKKHGAKIAIQLHHAGHNARSSIIGGQSVAPSAIARPGYEMPRALTVAEIKGVIARFVEAAQRAIRAGFDGVEIQGAHYHLIEQFLSPVWNKRDDEYGGSLENRARFLVETIQATRRAVGRDYPLWARLNGAEYGLGEALTFDELFYNLGGTERKLSESHPLEETIQEAKQVACMATAASADAISVSARGYGVHIIMHRPTPSESPGCLVPLAAGIKEAAKTMVMVGGRITPEMAERILQEGKADFIVMGRPIVADPHLPNKVASGRLADIRPCICCNYCGDIALHINHAVLCQVNPAVGKEREYDIKPAAKKKKVVVVGGGPAGMEAAREARLRGHDVTLLEEGTRLGGQLLMAARPPFKEPISPLIQYLERQMKELGVKVVLGKPAIMKSVVEMGPEVVVVAAGSEPVIPRIAGIEPGLKSGKVVLACDALREDARVGETVVVIGGEQTGCEVAEYFADRGRKVTVIEIRQVRALAEKAPVSVRIRLLNRLATKGVRMWSGVTAKAITGEGMLVSRDGNEEVLRADTIVLAAGAVPRIGLYQELKASLNIPLYLVGDAVQPRGIREAITEGARVGLEI